MTLSLTHQLNLVDEVTIAGGAPKLDYLDGEPMSQLGARPRHEVQFESGYYNNGLGARFQGNWRSGTTVESTSGDLDFSPFFDLDLRLWANLGENFDLVSKHPFFRGSSIRLDVENVLNNRPKVRDSSGLTPLSYQPDLLEPMSDDEIRKVTRMRQKRDMSRIGAATEAERGTENGDAEGGEESADDQKPLIEYDPQLKRAVEFLQEKLAAAAPANAA